MVAELLLDEVVIAVDRLVVLGATATAVGAAVAVDIGAVVADFVARAVEPGVQVGVADRFVHLVTCDADHGVGREVVVGRLVAHRHAPRKLAAVRTAREPLHGVVVDGVGEVGVDRRAGKAVVTAEGAALCGDRARAAAGVIGGGEARLNALGEEHQVQLIEVAGEAVGGEVGGELRRDLGVGDASCVAGAVGVGLAAVGRAATGCRIGVGVVARRTGGDVIEDRPVARVGVLLEVGKDVRRRAGDCSHIRDELLGDRLIGARVTESGRRPIDRRDGDRRGGAHHRTTVEEHWRCPAIGARGRTRLGCAEHRARAARSAPSRARPGERDTADRSDPGRRRVRTAARDRGGRECCRRGAEHERGEHCEQHKGSPKTPPRSTCRPRHQQNSNPLQPL